MIFVAVAFLLFNYYVFRKVCLYACFTEVGEGCFLCFYKAVIAEGDICHIAQSHIALIVFAEKVVFNHNVFMIGNAVIFYLRIGCDYGASAICGI